MKTMQFVIQEVARRTGQSESLVEKIIRSAESDCREFLAEKRGYSIWFPNLGTFTFRVSFITKYISMQRYQLAYWKYRLKVGVAKGNNRTVVAATENIDKYTYRIRHALLIKSEYLEKHSKYNKQKQQYIHRTAAADISRLEELLDVEVLVREFEAKYQGKEGHLPAVPGEGSLPPVVVQDTKV